MIQQGQVFKLKAKGPDGQPLWAYRHRIEGRGSERPQVGGFATRAEAEKALRKVLDRLGAGGGGAAMGAPSGLEGKPLGGGFSKPPTDSNPRPPPYPWGGLPNS